MGGRGRRLYVACMRLAAPYRRDNEAGWFGFVTPRRDETTRRGRTGFHTVRAVLEHGERRVGVTADGRAMKGEARPAVSEMK
jgi:hypothetical protein